LKPDDDGLFLEHDKEISEYEALDEYIKVNESVVNKGLTYQTASQQVKDLTEANAKLKLVVSCKQERKSKVYGDLKNTIRTCWKISALSNAEIKDLERTMV
jgi:hypothetical protein